MNGSNSGTVSITRDNIVIRADDICVEEIDLMYGVPMIEAYIETWFDVDKRFGTCTEDDETTLELYALYSPTNDTMVLMYTVQDSSDSNTYETSPTDEEKLTIKSLISEAIMKEYGQTIAEYYYFTLH